MFIEFNFFIEKFLPTDGVMFFITAGYDNPFVCDTKVTFPFGHKDLQIELGHSSEERYFYYDCPFRERTARSPLTFTSENNWN